MNFNKPRPEEPEINLIPFIDVLLVILIFLMLSTTYSKFTELQVALPVADAEQARDRPHEIIVAVAADGRYAVELARDSGGSVEAIPDGITAEAIRDVARLEGIFPETAGGVTLGAVAAAKRRGVIRAGDEVVALLTGNGLKTPDARTLGHGDGVARPGQPGLAPAIRPSLAAFERWLGGDA